MTEQVREIMMADPVTVSPQTPIDEAARLMRDQNIGDVLVADGGQLRGLVTDRDLTVRALADDKPLTTSVQEVCSQNPVSCAPGDDVERAAALMREHALRRLPVVDEGRLVGVVSIGDLAIERDPTSALADISATRPNT